MDNDEHSPTVLKISSSNGDPVPSFLEWRYPHEHPRNTSPFHPSFLAPTFALGEGHHDIIGQAAKELTKLGFGVERRHYPPALNQTDNMNSVRDCGATHFLTCNFMGLPKEPIPEGVRVVSWQWDTALRLLIQRPWLLDVLSRDSILPCTMKPDVDYLFSLGFQNAFWLPACVSPDAFHPMPQVQRVSGFRYPLWNRFGIGLESIISRFPSVAHFEQWLAPIEIGGLPAAMVLAEKLLIGDHSGPLGAPTELACLLWVSARDLTRWRRIASLEPFNLTIITPLPRQLWPSSARNAKGIRHIQGTVSYPDGCNQIYNTSAVTPFPGECTPGPSYWNPRIFESIAAGSCQCAFLNPEDSTDPCGLFAALAQERELPAAYSLDAWHSKIEHMLTHPAEAQEIAAAARKRVLGQHTMRQRVEQLVMRLGHIWCSS
jgi:hypothetical protein